MSGLIQDPELALVYQTELLVSESQRRYSSVRDAILEQLGPRDFVEHMWTAEIVEAEWEALRLRHFKPDCQFRQTPGCAKSARRTFVTHRK